MAADMASCEAVHPLTDEEITSRMLLLDSGNRGSYVHKAVNTLDVCGLTPAQIEELHPGQTSPSHKLPDARGATPGAVALRRFMATDAQFVATVCPPGTDAHSYAYAYAAPGRGRNEMELKQCMATVFMPEAAVAETKFQTVGPSPVEAGKQIVCTYVVKLDLEAKVIRMPIVMMTI